MSEDFVLGFMLGATIASVIWFVIMFITFYQLEKHINRLLKALGCC